MKGSDLTSTWPTFQVVQTTLSYWQSLLSWKSVALVRAAMRAFKPLFLHVYFRHRNLHVHFAISINIFTFPNRCWVKIKKSPPEQMSNQEIGSQFPLLVTSSKYKSSFLGAFFSFALRIRPKHLPSYFTQRWKETHSTLSKSTNHNPTSFSINLEEGLTGWW